MGSEGGEELGQYTGIDKTGQIQLATIICSTVCPELNMHASIVCKLFMIVAPLYQWLFFMDMVLWLKVSVCQCLYVIMLLT